MCTVIGAGGMAIGCGFGMVQAQYIYVSIRLLFFLDTIGISISITNTDRIYFVQKKIAELYFEHAQLAESPFMYHSMKIVCPLSCSSSNFLCSNVSSNFTCSYLEQYMRFYFYSSSLLLKYHRGSDDRDYTI